MGHTTGSQKCDTEMCKCKAISKRIRSILLLHLDEAMSGLAVKTNCYRKELPTRTSRSAIALRDFEERKRFRQHTKKRSCTRLIEPFEEQSFFPAKLPKLCDKSRHYVI